MQALVSSGAQPGPHAPKTDVGEELRTRRNWRGAMRQKLEISAAAGVLASIFPTLAAPSGKVAFLAPQQTYE